MRTFSSRIVIAGALLAVLGIAAAAPLAAPPDKRFVDNGDGTVTDTQTRLMWEKKADRNVNDAYTWSSTGTAADGTLFTKFLATMRCEIKAADGSCGFARHNDWRIPTIAELQTIVDCGQPRCLDPIFGLTAAPFYWSSSTHAGSQTAAWIVILGNGLVVFYDKGNTFHVRAVRGGQ
jgi:hypothetical protein